MFLLHLSRTLAGVAMQLARAMPTSDYAWLGEASFVASLNPVARITRLVAGPTDDPDER